jgi:hypothetical protein
MSQDKVSQQKDYKESFTFETLLLRDKILFICVRIAVG